MTASECREKIKNFCVGCNIDWEANCEETCEFPTIEKALDLLEAKEQNKLIELPVPIGSTVYGISSKNEIYEFELSIHFPLGMLKTLMSVWGKEVFATREEAEARLKELKNDNN